MAIFASRPCGNATAEENGAIGIVVGRNASPAERSAGEELCGYLEKLYPRQQFRSAEALPAAGRAILLGTPSGDDRIKGLLPDRDLSKPESYLVAAKKDGPRTLGVIAGADPRGVVYGVYGLLDKLGCGFYLSGDALPPAKTEDFSFAGWDLADAPLVRERIVFNWHNFLSGCSTWNLDHWKQWTLQAQKGGYNAIMVHAYGNNPMASFEFGGKQKPVGYLSTTAKGRDWATMHVNDVRRLWGGEIFDGPVFGSEAALVPEERRVAAAQKMMRDVFAFAQRRAMDVYFAVDVDTAPANAQELIETLPPDARFTVKMKENSYAVQRGGPIWLPNPDAPAGYRYYKTQVESLLKTYPQITCLLIWFRGDGTAPWMTFRRQEMPAAWQEEYRAELAKTPEAAKYHISRNMFATAKIARAFQRALKELGREDVELGAGSWRFRFVPAADRFFPREVKLLPLDYDVLAEKPQLSTADLRKVIRDAGVHRRIVPIVWAHHDDGHYFGRPYRPFDEFQSKLSDAKASGFGVIHWLTRPLDLYFSSSSKQVWRRSQNQPLAETCREMAERRFGVSTSDILGRYLERWINEAPQFGRETRVWFLMHRLSPLAQTDPGNRERRVLLEQIDAAALSPEGRIQLDYQRNLEQFTEDFHKTHHAIEQAQIALSTNDLATAREKLRSARPEQIIEQFVKMCKYGGPSRGEQGLAVSLNLRWLVHIIRLRQALGEEAVRLNFAPTMHEAMAQGANPFTYFVDRDRKYWDCRGAEETGASVFVLPENTAPALSEGMPESYREICQNGIEGDKEFSFRLKPIFTVLAGYQKAFSAVLPGKYRVRLLFAEPTATAAGQRVMEVMLDDAAKIPADRVDIFRQAGGRNRILERIYDVEVGSAGAVKVTLKPVAGKIMICGAILEPVSVPRSVKNPTVSAPWWLVRLSQSGECRLRRIKISFAIM
ncbi:MAG: hypothetical protein IT426_11180 [Pirellulales bacterium]|nr:hypothetical protein [Pirellulales bacterium]